MNRVLLLDSTMYPIDIIDWKKAIIYIFQEKVDVLDSYNQFINSTNERYQLPKVLKLKVKHKRKLIAPSSKKIKKRDNNTCAYCGNIFDDKELSIDHIIPKATGKIINTWENLITSCIPCNLKKGGRTPDQAKMRLLFKATKINTPIVYLIRNEEKEVFKDWIFIN